jgi:predicted Zn-dependent protease
MFREAEREYSKILALEPDSVAGFAGLSAAYLRDGNPEQAQANAQKALARSPEDSELNLLMGEIMVAEHKYAEAEPYLKHSLNARPDLLARVHALLGRIYARIGRPKEAMSELTQGLASDEDGSVYYQLARLYQSSGDAKAAAAAFEKSNRVRSRHQNPAIEILAPVQAQGDSPER